MSHTPGPWFVREPDGDEHTEVYAEKTGAVCYPEHDDAYLIAAAPEMLAACREALSAITYLLSNDDDDPNYEDTLTTLAAAIAKAEGRPDETTPD